MAMEHHDTDKRQSCASLTHASMPCICGKDQPAFERNCPGYIICQAIDIFVVSDKLWQVLSHIRGLMCASIKELRGLLERYLRARRSQWSWCYRSMPK